MYYVAVYAQLDYTGYLIWSPFAAHPTLMCADADAVKDIFKNPKIDKEMAMYNLTARFGPNALTTDSGECKRHRNAIEFGSGVERFRRVCESVHGAYTSWSELLDSRAHDGVTEDGDVVTTMSNLAVTITSDVLLGLDMAWEGRDDMDERSGGIKLAQDLRGLVAGRDHNSILDKVSEYHGISLLLILTLLLCPCSSSPFWGKAETTTFTNNRSRRAWSS